MPEPTTDPTAIVRARGRRAALGFVLVLAIAFIADSTVQIVSAVFGLGVQPLPRPQTSAEARRCALGILTLEQTNLPLAWDDADAIARACERVAGGRDAWAALERLRTAQQLTPQDRAALGRLRDDVGAYLPPELR